MKPIAVMMIACAVFGLFFSACGDSGKDDGILTLAVVPKGTSHEFWKSIHAGAVKASRELDVKIIWKGPRKEDDREEQIKVIEDFIARKVDGIVLAPLDDMALCPSVAEAVAEGIPVVIIDSGLQSDKTVSFVATDNHRGGCLAARRLGGLLNGKGKVVLLRYQEGSASTMERERGFMETVRAEFPGLEMISDKQYAGATTESAMKKAENLLNRFAEIDGIFCPNESSTFGMLRALQNAGRAGRIKFVGFDASEKLATALRKGEMHGLVLQNPFRMGEIGVATLVDYIKAGKPEKRIDTGVVIATAENMDETAIRELLEPDLDRWLK
jgi:ribose transport system substrate-binding protein